jgi:hypothetical protein
MTPYFRMTVFVLLVIPAAILLLTGCASGVRMTDEEAIACRDLGCTAWTDAELLQLVNKAGSVGYRKGWEDAHRQAGRDM